MSLEVRNDLVRSVLIDILLAGGDLTGLPMNGLVSYEEQHTSALKALDTRIRVIGVSTRGRRFTYGWVLAGEPLIPGRRPTSFWILNFVDLTQSILRPDVVVVHRQIGRSVGLHDHLDSIS